LEKEEAMTWKQFCDLGNVPRWYQSVEIKNLTIPRRADGDSYERMAKSFIQKPQNVVLFGPAGRGKTHFTFALMRGLLDSRPDLLPHIRFFKSKELDDRILAEAKQYGSAGEFLRTIKEIKYLFVDDFGMERGTERSIRDYYDIIDARLHDMQTTVISTNLNESLMGEYFGERVYSRLKEFIWVEFDGPDLRGGRSL
jgi:DNA replication protein DnaC